VSGRHPYKDVIKKRRAKKGKKKGDVSEEMEKWRAYWREAGPVRFAEEVLPCWPENPIHPELGKIPEYNILSEEQKKFLIDLWKRGFAGYVLLAGRGSGKTYILAIYACWRICCFDYWTMTIMGGSSGQSLKGKKYIDFWRIRVKEIYYCLPRSIGGGQEAPHIESRWMATVHFPACSETGARSPHVREVHIDEVCTGEHKSKEGAIAIEAAQFQVTSSPDPMLGYISTAQYVTGNFVKLVKNHKKFGYRFYRWSLARHIGSKWYKRDGKTPNWDYIDTVLYKDRKPENWIPNVWWETTKNIRNFRKKTSNDQWLVEILGGISRGTGLVFSREDLRACICKGNKWTKNGGECGECRPYTEHCPMMKKKGWKNISGISNRKAGVDFGDPAPNSLTVVGMRGKTIYTLYSDERVGLRTTEVVEWVDRICKKYKVWEIFADPEERSMTEALEDKGYSCPNIWRLGGGVKKNYYVQNFKRLMEQHRFFIPMKFYFLITSLEELSFDERGKVRKHNDHSFDGKLYATSDYDVAEDAEGLSKEMRDKAISMW